MMALAISAAFFTLFAGSVHSVVGGQRFIVLALFGIQINVFLALISSLVVRFATVTPAGRPRSWVFLTAVTAANTMLGILSVQGTLLLILRAVESSAAF